MYHNLVLGILLLLSFAPAGTIEHTFHFYADRVIFGTAEDYQTVDYPCAAHIEHLGMPDLPAVISHFLIPSDAVITNFEVTSVQEEPLPGEFHILPVQHPVPFSIDPPKQPFVEPDPQVYEEDALYPLLPAEIGTAGNKSGYRLVDFCVYPLRYNPVRRTLSLTKSITVRLSYATGRRPAQSRTELQNAIHGSHVANLVVNSQDVARFAPPVRREETKGSFLLPPGQFEHIVITRAIYADSFAQLCAWRTRQGWRSRVMPLESILTTYPGRDDAEKMRNFIKDADTTWGTIYVFIARDDYPSGSNQVRIARAYNYNMKCDQYFSDLDGDWDRNGNSVFGEVADSVDGYADVFVGMITLKPGYNKLGNYLDKLFRYELNPDTTVTWVTKDLLPNGVTFSNNFNDSVANASPTPPWFDCKMYSSGGMVTPTPQRFCDSLNSGYGFGSIIAHGSPDLFQLGGNVTSAMLNTLTNPNRLNFSTYVCCNTGEWDLGSTNGDCIAENMVFHAPNGFIGVCKNDKSGWVNCAELFNYAIAYGYYGFRTGRRPTMGEVLAYGKDYWTFRIKDSAKYRMESFERNLFGEPAVPLWTGQPFIPRVVKPEAVGIGENIPVQISVYRGETPVCSALVCLTKDGETFARGWTNSRGEVILLVSPLTPGTMKLTITNSNCIPYLDSIQVITGGCYLVFTREAVSDPPPGGNGNGRLDPGEIAQVKITLRNIGGKDGYRVTGELISGDNRLSVTDPLGSWGNIPRGDSAINSADPFTLMADPTILPGTTVKCTLRLRADTVDYERDIIFTLTVGKQPTPPGQTLWGPKIASGLPTEAGLQGLAYNRVENVLYCCHYLSPYIYKFSSDSSLAPLGSIPAPEDSCTDLTYCSYDNTFWVLANASKRLYKITPSGTILRSLPLLLPAHPVGIAEEPYSRTLYVSDRRFSGQTPQYIYMLDTLGNVLGVLDHPLSGNLGPRCLALDEGNPVFPPSLLNIYTWYNSSGTTPDSCGMYELEQGSGVLLRGFRFPTATWDVRGIEYDPRDGSYWVTVMRNGNAKDQIVKVTGFNLPVGITEPYVSPSVRGLEFRIGPNPFIRGTWLSYVSETAQEVKLDVFDACGRRKETVIFSAQKGNNQFYWEPEHLPAGIYFVEFSTPERTERKRIVLTK